MELCGHAEVSRVQADEPLSRVVPEVGGPLWRGLWEAAGQ